MYSACTSGFDEALGPGAPNNAATAAPATAAIAPGDGLVVPPLAIGIGGSAILDLLTLAAAAAADGRFRNPKAAWR